MANLVKYTYNTSKILNFTDNIPTYAPITNLYFDPIYARNSQEVLVFYISNIGSAPTIQYFVTKYSDSFTYQNRVLKYKNHDIGAMVFIYNNTNTIKIIRKTTTSSMTFSSITSNLDNPVIENILTTDINGSHIYIPTQALLFNFQSNSYELRKTNPQGIIFTNLNIDINNIQSTTAPLLWKEGSIFYSLKEYICLNSGSYSGTHPYYYTNSITKNINPTARLYQMEQHTNDDWYNYYYSATQAYVNEDPTATNRTKHIVPKTRLVKITNSSGTTRLLKTDQ